MAIGSSRRRVIASRIATPRAAIALMVGLSIMLLHLLTRSDLLALAIALPVLILLAPIPSMDIGLVPQSDARLGDQAALHDFCERQARSADHVLPALICLAPSPDSSSNGIANRSELEIAAEAIRTVLRPEDAIAWDPEGTLTVALSSRSDSAVETLIQIALRIQKRLREPCASKEGTLSYSTAIGICSPGPRETGHGSSDTFAEAKAALALAMAKGPFAIEVAERESAESAALGVQIAQDLDKALGDGQIHAFFQPQVCTDTGKLTGLEALARWCHPVHGFLSPAQFLPTIAAAGAERALTDTIIADAVRALKMWDDIGLNVPSVSVNVTYADLNDPDLPTRCFGPIAASGLTAERLGIEVLETVLSLDANDHVSRNLSRLSAMGCQIDLDDFGTGQASIASIRRFSINRLKIDRSFVRGVDHDPEQQSMVAAIVTMADQLKIEVLAEGIETAAEHAEVARLGCRSVQGFGIGRPMPLEAIEDWYSAWQEQLAANSSSKPPHHAGDQVVEVQIRTAS